MPFLHTRTYSHTHARTLDFVKNCTKQERARKCTQARTDDDAGTAIDSDFYRVHGVVGIVWGMVHARSDGVWALLLHDVDCTAGFSQGVRCMQIVGVRCIMIADAHTLLYVCGI